MPHIFILFAQEVLHTSVFVFAILGTAGAIGGILGGLLGPKISSKIGSGPSLVLALVSAAIGNLIVGLTSSWQVVLIVTAIEIFLAVLWNTITVSLRQSIIPMHLLGRVNSVYRFFAWGSIPIGLLVGGSLVSVATHYISRENALRFPYLLSVALGLVILTFATPRLTTSKIEHGRAESSQ